MLTMLTKVPVWIWIIVAAGGYFWWSQNKIDSLQADITRSRLEGQGTVQIDTGMYARLTEDRIEKDSLVDALAVAEELNAELVAAARITLTPDTVYRDTTVLTTVVYDDKTRVANVIDTTNAGILRASIVAPRFPGSILWSYTFIPAPITFTASLLRLQDETAIFAVSYQGQNVEISAPYARLPAKPKTLVPYVGGFYDLGASSFGFRGGARIKVPWIKLYAFGELEQLLKQEIEEVANPLRIRIGALWEFR